MPGLSTTRRAATLIAITGAGALIATAAPYNALGAARPSASAHHSSARSQHHHAREFVVRGLVAAHAHRTVTVFAKTIKVGQSTRHDRRVHLHFAHVRHAKLHMPVGDRIRVHAVGRIHGKDITVVRHNDEVVNAAPASLLFGTIDSVNADGDQMVVTQLDRDNGDIGTGRDSRHGGDGNHSGDVARLTEHHHGKSAHRITVDFADAAVTVDGSTDTAPVAGDTVAVLGEITEDTVVASDVFGFTTAPAFLRGEISTIDGNTVVLNGDRTGEEDAVRASHDEGGNDNGVVVSLKNVPLVFNGDAGASVADLSVGDKLVVLGSGGPASGAFAPELAFAFNHKDDNPCGHNDQGGDD